MSKGTPHAELDVRGIEPKNRHSRIFSLYESLEGGESFQLTNDHDPVPLRHQFAQRYPGGFDWSYVETGPTVWRVRIGKPEADHCCL